MDMLTKPYAIQIRNRYDQHCGFGQGNTHRDAIYDALRKARQSYNFAEYNPVRDIVIVTNK